MALAISSVSPTSDKPVATPYREQTGDVEKSYVKIPKGFLPGVLADFLKFDKLFMPWAQDNDGLRISPIP